MKKAQGISMNVIIISAVILLVIVVIIGLSGGLFTSECPKKYDKYCQQYNMSECTDALIPIISATKIECDNSTILASLNVCKKDKWGRQILCKDEFFKVDE